MSIQSSRSFGSKSGSRSSGGTYIRLRLAIEIWATGVTVTGAAASLRNFRFTPESGHPADRQACPLSANIGHSLRFALAIRHLALCLTKKHNFLSPKDDRKRGSSDNK